MKNIVNIKKFLIEKYLVFKYKSGLFLDKLSSKLIGLKNAVNSAFDYVLDIIALIKDIIGLKIENCRINKIIKLETKISKIKGKIGYK